VGVDGSEVLLVELVDELSAEAEVEARDPKVTMSMKARSATAATARTLLRR
jgi:hypothetical protein